MIPGFQPSNLLSFHEYLGRWPRLVSGRAVGAQECGDGVLLDVWGGSIPDIPFVEWDVVFFEKGPVFLLKGARSVVLRLGVDILFQRIQMPGANGKGPISPLP